MNRNSITWMVFTPFVRTYDAMVVTVFDLRNCLQVDICFTFCVPSTVVLSFHFSVPTRYVSMEGAYIRLVI